jgi:hypothetical protein
MDTEHLSRPPVAIGHVWLRVTELVQATQYFVTLGLRLIHQAQAIAVLELRGGTHLVLQPAPEPIPPGMQAPFDLMVDDIVATRQHYEALGLNPSALASGTVHRSFTLSGPDGYAITVTSSHTGGRIV